MEKNAVGVEGSVAAGFDGVRDAFIENFRVRGDVGATFCAYVNGREVAHLWGGEAEPGQPWRKNTLVCAFSTAKAVTALAIQVLADRGLLDIDQPIAKVWPEFAAAGKASITPRTILSHKGGLVWWHDYARTVNLDEPETFSRYEGITAALAAAPPIWEPGSRSGYASFTYGWILAEVVRRVSGKRLGEFIRDEICRPLEVEDYWLGLPAQHHRRIASVRPDPDFDGEGAQALMNPGTDAGRSFLLKSQPLGTALRTAFNHPLFRAAEQGAGNPLTEGRSLARMFAMLACGGTLNGTRVVSEDSIREFSRESAHGIDAVLGTPIRMALGYMRTAQGGWYFGPTDEAFGHPGFGGAMVFADPVRRVSFAWIPNRMKLALETDARARALMDALYAAL